MYSFKYHLVTICAVFLSLAIGLLLGASIAGTGALSTTTSDLVDSLFERYSNLSSQNSEYSLRASQYQELSGEFIESWDDGRLEGRHILIVSGTSSNENNISEEVASYVEDAGGDCVIVRVNETAFGTSDADVLAALQEVLPEVEGTEYTQTLAQALVAEWTQCTGSDDDSDDDADDDADDDSDDADDDSDDESSSGPSATVYDGGSISGSSGLTDDDLEYCPVTACLLENGVITIEGSSNIPNDIDGYVDIYVEEITDDSDGDSDDSDDSDDDSDDSDDEDSAEYEADLTAARIGSAFNGAGASVVFTQSSDASSDLMDEASNRGVAGVSSYSGYMGRYSIVSLLESGDSGVYGPDRDSGFWYPSLQ